MKITYLSQHTSDIGTIITAKELYERGGKAMLISDAFTLKKWFGHIYEWRMGHRGSKRPYLVCVDDPQRDFWDDTPMSYDIEYFPLEIVE